MRTQKYVQKQTWVQFCTHAQSIKNLIGYFSTSSFLRLSLVRRAAWSLWPV